jgi:membrane protein implicated in regulation of membrane protease activity
MTYQVWLMASVVFIILEILPPPTHFFFLCLAIGSLGASITALFSSIPWLPWIVFAVVTVALTPFLIPLAKFLFTPKQHASNVDELIGKKAKVLEAIEVGDHGQVKMGSEEWRAVSLTENFEKGSWVLVDKIEGTSVIVRSLS